MENSEIQALCTGWWLWRPRSQHQQAYPTNELDSISHKVYVVHIAIGFFDNVLYLIWADGAHGTSGTADGEPCECRHHILSRNWDEDSQIIPTCTYHQKYDKYKCSLYHNPFKNTMSAKALLDSNAIWAKEVCEHDPDFCPNSAKGQTPHVRPLFLKKKKKKALKRLLDSLDRLCGFQSARVGHHRFQTWRPLCPPKYREVRFSTFVLIKFLMPCL